MEARSCLYSWKIHAWCWEGSRPSCCPGWKEECFGVQCSEEAAEVCERCCWGPTRLQGRRLWAINLLWRPAEKVQCQSSQSLSHQHIHWSNKCKFHTAQNLIRKCRTTYKQSHISSAPIYKYIVYLQTSKEHLTRQEFRNHINSENTPILVVNVTNQHKD